MMAVLGREVYVRRIRRAVEVLGRGACFNQKHCEPRQAKSGALYFRNLMARVKRLFFLVEDRYYRPLLDYTCESSV